MKLPDNGVAVAAWRRLLICLAMALLLLGGIRLHALQFTVAASSAVSTNHLPPNQRQSFDTDAGYCIAPPCVFLFEPAPAVVSQVAPAQDVFLPPHPDGWYCNRPPPAL
ncbi:MAG: hypothetical protein ACM3PW_14935 [Chlamydiota bacterium]